MRMNAVCNNCLLHPYMESESHDIVMKPQVSPMVLCYKVTCVEGGLQFHTVPYGRFWHSVSFDLRGQNATNVHNYGVKISGSVLRDGIVPCIINMYQDTFTCSLRFEHP